MRTIKFLVLSATLLTAAPALAQSGLQPGAFPRVDRLARVEARQIERRQLRRHIAANRNVRLRMATRLGVKAGARPGFRVGGRHTGFQMGPRAGFRAGVRAGFRAGRIRGLRAKTSPAARAFHQQLRTERQAVRAQVTNGQLTREQAHTQMRRWITEHRPNK